MTTDQHPKQKPRYFGLKKRYIVLLTILIIGSCLAIYSFPRLSCGPVDARMVASQVNLHGIGLAIICYSENNSGYLPPADSWCDALVNTCSDQTPYLNKEHIEWPNKQVEFGYSFNRNVDGLKFEDIPSDTVLVFESKKGWNLAEGQESMIFAHPNTSCNVLFANGFVQNMRAEELLKKPLRWTIPEGNSDILPKSEVKEPER